MNKISLIISIFLFFLVSFSLFKTYDRAEVAYVDINKLVEGYTRTEVERKKFEEKSKKFNASSDSIMNGWRLELQSFEKERSQMSNEEIKLKEEILRNKQQKINQVQQAIEKEIQKADQVSTQTIVNDINDFVKEFGESNNYELILGASGNGNIMYASEGIDLTDEVLEELNLYYQENK